MYVLAAVRNGSIAYSLGDADMYPAFSSYRLDELSEFKRQLWGSCTGAANGKPKVDYGPEAVAGPVGVDDC